jgi:hypothetical protein
MHHRFSDVRFPLQVGQYASAAVVYVQDLYINALYAVYRAWTLFCVWLIRTGTVYSHLAATGPFILCAVGARADLTLALRWLYAVEREVTTALMYRWVYKFVGDVDQVDVVFFKNGKIYAARVDTEKDMELLTNSRIIDGLVTLENLPAVKLFTADNTKAQ